MSYSKSGFASKLGISGDELKKKAKAAGFDTTEAFFNATNGTGTMPKTSAQLMNEQKVQEDDYLKRFGGFVKNLPSYSDIATRYGEEIGLPQASQFTQGLVSQGLTLGQQLQNLPEQIQNENRGFDVNATQQARIEQLRGSDITRDLSDVSTAATRAGSYEQVLRGDLANKLGYEASQRQLELLPWESEANMLSARLAREATGWGIEQGNELTMLLNKMENEQQLNVAELGQLQNLALKEKDFEIFKKQLDYQQKYKSPTTQLGSIGNSIENYIRKFTAQAQVPGSVGPYLY